jgi:hypothetical protein
VVRIFPSVVDGQPLTALADCSVQNTSIPLLDHRIELFFAKVAYAQKRKTARASGQGESTNGALAKIVSVPTIAVQLNCRLGNRRVNACWGARVHCEAYILLASARELLAELHFLSGSSRNDFRPACLLIRAISSPDGTCQPGLSCSPALGPLLLQARQLSQGLTKSMVVILSEDAPGGPLHRGHYPNWLCALVRLGIVAARQQLRRLAGVAPSPIKAKRPQAFSLCGSPGSKI